MTRENRIAKKNKKNICLLFTPSRLTRWARQSYADKYQHNLKINGKNSQSDGLIFTHWLSAGESLACFYLSNFSCNYRTDVEDKHNSNAWPFELITQSFLIWGEVWWLIRYNLVTSLPLHLSQETVPSPALSSTRYWCLKYEPPGQTLIDNLHHIQDKSYDRTLHVISMIIFLPLWHHKMCRSN